MKYGRFEEHTTALSYYGTYLVIRPGRRNPLQNNHESLDLSCKTDLDFCGCFGREKYPTAELVQLINLSRVILKEKIPVL